MSEWIIAVVAIVSSFTGHVSQNEAYVHDQLAIVTGIAHIPREPYSVAVPEGYRSYTDESTIYLARPRMREFRHELTHIRFSPIQDYSPGYHEAVAEYIADRLGEYSHPYERLSNYALTPLVCAAHMPTYDAQKMGGDNTWYAYQVWTLVIKQQAHAKDTITIAEFYEPTHIAHWLEAYREVCT